MKNRAYIDLVRTMGILFVVFWHTYIVCFDKSDILKFLNPFAAMMPLITFISGYLFRILYQECHYKSFNTLAIKKFIRLIIPMLVFSFLYIDYKSLSLTTIDKVLNGVGPLWYLIMLFWNFLYAFIFYKLVDQIKNKQKYRLTMALSLIFLFILIYIPLPEHLGINTSSNYIFYFIFGGFVSENRSLVYRYTNKKIAIIFLILFIPLYIVCMQVIPINHIGKVIGGNIIRFYVLAMIPICCYYYEDFLYRYLKPIANNSFGIYIIHAFVLLQLKYILPSTLYVPIVVYIVAILISYGITVLSRKTRIGGYLMK